MFAPGGDRTHNLMVHCCNSEKYGLKCIINITKIYFNENFKYSIVQPSIVQKILCKPINFIKIVYITGKNLAYFTL